VPVVMAIETIAALMSPVGTDGLANEAGRVLGNAASMVCIASIVFVFREVLHGFNATLSVAERHFRLAYMGGVSLLVGVSILWTSGADAGSFAAEWNGVLLTGGGLIALGVSRLAVQYRLLNPLEKAARS
jgi:hypothetical protein